MELLSKKDLCRILGGTGRPIDQSTVYRLIRKGILPKPIKIGAGMSRWIALSKMMELRQ